MIRTQSTLLAALLLLATPATAQESKPAKAKPVAWPKLAKAKRDLGEHQLKLLLAKKDAVVHKARERLEVLGIGFGDRLFRRMSDAPHRQINQHLAEVLDKILKPEHARLVALHAGHKSIFARRYVVKTLCRFGEKVSTPTLRRARKDKDIEVRYYAAMGLVKIEKDLAALDVIYERCIDEWYELGDEVTRILGKSRGHEFIPWILEKLKQRETRKRVAVLRMMRAIAPKSAKSIVRPFLDSTVAILKKESINTLRVIVDGKPPKDIKKIPVFDVIKLANAWKKRI